MATSAISQGSVRRTIPIEFDVPKKVTFSIGNSQLRDINVSKCILPYNLKVFGSGDNTEVEMLYRKIEGTNSLTLEEIKLVINLQMNNDITPQIPPLLFLEGTFLTPSHKENVGIAASGHSTMKYASIANNSFKIPFGNKYPLGINMDEDSGLGHIWITVPGVNPQYMPDWDKLAQVVIAVPIGQAHLNIKGALSV